VQGEKNQEKRQSKRQEQRREKEAEKDKEEEEEGARAERDDEELSNERGVKKLKGNDRLIADGVTGRTAGGLLVYFSLTTYDLGFIVESVQPRRKVPGRV
jgi:hypothetical protein